MADRGRPTGIRQNSFPSHPGLFHLEDPSISSFFVPSDSTTPIPLSLKWRQFCPSVPENVGVIYNPPIECGPLRGHICSGAKPITEIDKSANHAHGLIIVISLITLFLLNT